MSEAPAPMPPMMRGASTSTTATAGDPGSGRGTWTVGHTARSSNAEIVDSARSSGRLTARAAPLSARLFAGPQPGVGLLGALPGVVPLEGKPEHHRVDTSHADSLDGGGGGGGSSTSAALYTRSKQWLAGASTATAPTPGGGMAVAGGGASGSASAFGLLHPGRPRGETGASEVSGGAPLVIADADADGGGAGAHDGGMASASKGAGFSAVVSQAGHGHGPPRRDARASLVDLLRDLSPPVFLDHCKPLSYDPLLDYFLHTAFLPSRLYFIQLQLAVLLFLGLVTVLWGEPTTYAAAIGQAAIICASLVAMLAFYFVLRPTKADERWNTVVDIYVFTLGIVQAVMNALNTCVRLSFGLAMTRTDATGSTAAGRTDDAGQPVLMSADALPSSPLVMAFTVMAWITFIASVCLFLLIVGSFFAVLWEGSAGEDTAPASAAPGAGGDPSAGGSAQLTPALSFVHSPSLPLPRELGREVSVASARPAPAPSG
jgi:hypothetical protein